MSAESISRIVASLLGLSGFTIAVLGGLAVENDGGTVLARALLAMVICQLVGLGIGSVGGRCIRENLENYRRNHPVREAELAELERAFRAVSGGEPG